MFDWLLDLFPFTVVPSSSFAHINLGEVFVCEGGFYKLLYRDAVKVKVLKWNALTRFIWRKKYGSAFAN